MLAGIMSWHDSQDGQYSDTRHHFVQGNDGTLFKHALVVLEHMKNILPNSAGKHILCPHLEYARSFSVSGGCDGGKVEVVSKDNVLVLPRLCHDLRVPRARITLLRPVHCLDSMCGKKSDPFR